MAPPQDVPQLAPPGAGLPWIQQAFGRFLWLPYLAATSSWETSLRRFQAAGDRILSLVDPMGPQQMRRRVLVHGGIGIEDSSRFWSPAMVLEHLVIVGDIIADIVVDLTHDRAPVHHVQIANLKPPGALSPEQSLTRFRELLACYERRMRDEVGDRQGDRRWHHPWFGEIKAHAWHCLAGLHQGIHRRQMEAILQIQNSEFKTQKVGIRR